MLQQKPSLPLQLLSEPQTLKPFSRQSTISQQHLKQKQILLHQFYTSDNNEQKLSIIKKWPNKSVLSSIQSIKKPIKTNNAWYFGRLCNQLFHGYGLIIYEKINMMDQQVKVIKKNQVNKEEIFMRYYQGYFQNNYKHGYGLQYINGDIYIGKFINDKPEDSKGVFVWKNGDTYMGSLVNGMKHGKGKWQSGDDYYEGMWKLNKPEGVGKIQTAVSEYEGDVKNGYKHGKGIQIFQNGDQYEGNYSNGKPEGEGVYKWKNGAIYKGKFKNGVRYGYGYWTYGNESYEGEYINDKRNGKGLYKWEKGSYYEGEFLDDLRHGFGQMYWSDKSHYKGQWREGQQSGEGQMWQNGKLLNSGIFSQGKFIQQLIKPKKNPNTINPNDNNLNQTKSNTLPKQKIIRFNNIEGLKIGCPTIEQKNKTIKCQYHHYQKLTQVGQFPKVHKNKYTVKPIMHSNTIDHSIHHSNHLTQEMSLNFLHRRKKNFIQTPPTLISPQSNQKTKSPKLLHRWKKKISTKTKNSSKSIDIKTTKINQWQFQPIKWKNFDFVKNNPSNTMNRFVYDQY